MPLRGGGEREPEREGRDSMGAPLHSVVLWSGEKEGKALELVFDSVALDGPFGPSTLDRVERMYHPSEVRGIRARRVVPRHESRKGRRQRGDTLHGRAICPQVRSRAEQVDRPFIERVACEQQSLLPVEQHERVGSVARRQDQLQSPPAEVDYTSVPEKGPDLERTAHVTVLVDAARQRAAQGVGADLPAHAGVGPALGRSFG